MATLTYLNKQVLLIEEPKAASATARAVNLILSFDSNPSPLTLGAGSNKKSELSQEFRWMNGNT